MEHDDLEYEVLQTPCTSQCTVPSTFGTVTQITAQNTPATIVGA
jgi:hypothetical protein